MAHDQAISARAAFTEAQEAHRRARDDFAAATVPPCDPAAVERAAAALSAAAATLAEAADQLWTHLLSATEAAERVTNARRKRRNPPSP